MALWTPNFDAVLGRVGWGVLGGLCGAGLCVVAGYEVAFVNTFTGDGGGVIVGGFVWATLGGAVAGALFGRSAVRALYNVVESLFGL